MLCKNDVIYILCMINMKQEKVEIPKMSVSCIIIMFLHLM